MPYTKEQKAQANREYRARKALAAGRLPGVNGRPKLIGPLKPHHFSRDDRSAEYVIQKERRRVVAKHRDGENGGPINPMDVPIYAQAVEVADSLAHKDRRTSVADDLWEDLVCEASLAICEGNDPYEMAKAYKSRWYNWRNVAITGVIGGADQMMMVEQEQIKRGLYG